MKLWITADASWESRTDRITNELVRNESYFAEKFYGKAIERISLILMCRDPALNFQRRTKYYKSKKEFYTDIMLDYEEMVQASMLERMAIAAHQISLQLEEALASKKLNEFNLHLFIEDLKAWLDSIKTSYDGHGSGQWRY